MKKFIETERLILREIDERDVQGIFELDSDPEVHRYLGNKPIASIEESESIIEYIMNQYKVNGIGRWAVIEKATNEFIGWAGLKYEKEVRKEMNYYDLGYRLKRKFWGKGIATEAAIESLKYGFNSMGLEEIYAGAHINNIASNKILRKLGFRFLETFEYDGSPHHWYKISNLDLQKKKIA